MATIKFDGNKTIDIRPGSKIQPMYIQVQVLTHLQ